MPNFYIVHSEAGYLQYKFQNEWHNISYSNFNSKTIDLTCKYFGYQSGMLIPQIKDIQLTYLFFKILCANNSTNLKFCYLKIDYDSQLIMKSYKVIILCLNKTTSCQFIPNLKNLMVEKFLGKCYYIYDSKEKKLNFHEIENFCLKKNLNIISLSTKDQAVFIFNKILLKKYKYEKKSMENIYDDIFIPLSK